jgi:hypothetical protein
MRALLCFAAAAALGCTHGAAPPPPARELPRPGPAAGSVGAPRAPLALEWVVKEVSGNRTALIARISRFAALQAPVEVTLRLPRGARLVSGPDRFSVPPAASPSVFEQEVTIECDGPPAEALLLEAHARGQAFGMHAKRAFIFGQAEKPVEAPRPEGPSVKIGTHDLGPAIPAR